MLTKGSQPSALPARGRKTVIAAEANPMSVRPRGGRAIGTLFTAQTTPLPRASSGSPIHPRSAGRLGLDAERPALRSGGKSLLPGRGKSVEGESIAAQWRLASRRERRDRAWIGHTRAGIPAHCRPASSADRGDTRLHRRGGIDPRITCTALAVTPDLGKENPHRGRNLQLRGIARMIDPDRESRAFLSAGPLPRRARAQKMHPEVSAHSPDEIPGNRPDLLVARGPAHTLPSMPIRSRAVACVRPDPGTRSSWSLEIAAVRTSGCRQRAPPGPRPRRSVDAQHLLHLVPDVSSSSKMSVRWSPAESCDSSCGP